MEGPINFHTAYNVETIHKLMTATGDRPHKSNFF